MRRQRDPDHDAIIVLILAFVICFLHFLKEATADEEPQREDQKKALQWAPQSSAPRLVPAHEESKRGSVFYNEQKEDQRTKEKRGAEDREHI